MNFDPIKGLVACAVIGALTFLAYKAPGQLNIAGTVIGGIVLALLSVKRDEP